MERVYRGTTRVGYRKLRHELLVKDFFQKEFSEHILSLSRVVRVGRRKDIVNSSRLYNIHPKRKQ